MKSKMNFTFPVYIDQNILEDIQIECRSSELEVFGYLIGIIYKWNKRFYIIIQDHLYIRGAVHSHQYSTSQIEGTAGKYEEKFRKLKERRRNSLLRVVGWWHSHPGFGCFLSNTDLITQQYFFPESYQVALVIDPKKNEYKFFSLENKSQKGYKEISHAVISS
jgi:proteasome lid subunit RPN8/RPN11